MVICSADRVSAWHVHPASHGGHLGKDGDLFELFRWNLQQTWHDIQVEKLVMMKPAELLLVTCYILAAIILQLLAGQRWGDNAGHDDVRNGVPPSTFTRIWYPVRYASSDIKCHIFCLVFVNTILLGLPEILEQKGWPSSVKNPVFMNPSKGIWMIQRHCWNCTKLHRFILWRRSRSLKIYVLGQLNFWSNNYVPTRYQDL